MMKAAGIVPSPEQMRKQNAGGEEDTLFHKYAGRIEKFAPFLTDDLRDMLGVLYAGAEAKGAGPDSHEMKKIDRLARDLASLSMTAAMSPETDEQSQTEWRGYGSENPAASRFDLRA